MEGKVRDLKLPESVSCTDALNQMSAFVTSILPEIGIYNTSHAPVIDKTSYDKNQRTLFALLCTKLPQGRASGILYVI